MRNLVIKHFVNDAHQIIKTACDMEKFLCDIYTVDTYIESAPGTK